MKRIAVAAVVLSIALPAAAQRIRSMRPISVWAVPQCSEVSGLRSMRYLRDGQVSKNHDTVVNDAASDIILGDTPNLMYAVYLDAVYESRDAGCTWKQHNGIPPAQGTTYIAAARKGTLYVYNQAMFLRINGAWTESINLPERMAKIGVDPADMTHLRAVAVTGNAYESVDSGSNWSVVGQTGTTSLVNTAAFDPSNFDHAIVGTSNGLLATTDGGKTWTAGTLTGVSAWEIEFSPADPRVVYVQAGSSLYRAIDGGTSFGTVQAPGITMSRSRLSAHPTQPFVIAVSVTDGIAIFDTGRGTTNMVKTIRPQSLEWLPTGILYFSAPDSIVVF